MAMSDSNGLEPNQAKVRILAPAIEEDGVRIYREFSIEDCHILLAPRLTIAQRYVGIRTTLDDEEVACEELALIQWPDPGDDFIKIVEVEAEFTEDVIFIL